MLIVKLTLIFWFEANHLYPIGLREEFIFKDSCLFSSITYPISNNVPLNQGYDW